MENPPPFLEAQISSATMRALVKSEGLTTHEEIDVLHLLATTERSFFRRWLTEALQAGENLRIIADKTKVIPYLGIHKYEFRSICRIQLGEALLGYIGDDSYLGFSLAA